MNSLKSFFMLLVLVGVGYGVYRTLHLKNPQQVPLGVDASIPAIAVPALDTKSTVPNFAATPASPAPTTLSPREPRRDNIVNSPLSMGSSSGPSATTPPATIGFGEPLKPAASGNDLKLDAPPAGDNPGSALLPPLAGLPKPGDLAPPAMSGLNAPANATPAATNLPAGATPLAGFTTTGSDVNQAALSPFGPVMKETQQLIAENKLSEALTRLTRIYDDQSMSASEQQQVNDLLNQLAGVVIYSTKYHLVSPHRIDPGETLDVIAKRYNVPWEMLAKINGLTDPKQLPVGQFLKVVPGPFRADVDLKKNKLTLFLKDQFAGTFDIVMLGSESQYTPADYVVQKRAMNPTYNNSQLNQSFGSGDPNNPIGNFALLLSDKMMIHGHGAQVPPSDPRGSVRLSAKDAEDIHDILSEGSQVKFRR